MRSVLLFIFFVGLGICPSTWAWSTSFGIGQRYNQTNIEDTSTAATATYAGYGFDGELRLRIGSGSTATSTSTNVKATPDLFILGGTLTQQNSSSSVGFSRKNSYVGGGLDFRFEHFFIGGQLLTNTATLETTTTTTTDTYSSIGLRLGYAVKLGMPTSGINLLFGLVSGIGRTPASTIPVSIITDNSVFVLLQFQLFKSSGVQ